MFKKIIGSLLIMFGLCFGAIAEEIPVQICYDGQVVQEMTMEEWVALTNCAEWFLKEIDAETDEPRRVRIVLIEEIWKIKNPDRFDTQMVVQWLDNDGDVFKEIIINVEIVIDENTRNFSDWRIKYRNIAEWGFPISMLFNILFIGIIILL